MKTYIQEMLLDRYEVLVVRKNGLYGPCFAVVVKDTATAHSVGFDDYQSESLEEAFEAASSFINRGRAK